MNEQTLTLEKCYHSDCCEWEQSLTVTLSVALQSAIRKVRKFLAECDEIYSVNLQVPVGFWSFETEQRLQEQCRFDVCYLAVNRFSFCLYLQGKYDSQIQAEWSVV